MLIHVVHHVVSRSFRFRSSRSVWILLDLHMARWFLIAVITPEVLDLAQFPIVLFVVVVVLEVGSGGILGHVLCRTVSSNEHNILSGGARSKLTLDSLLISLGFAHEQSSCLAVEWICWVWVSEQLWEEDFEYVDHVEHGRPGLVDDI
jgi:hypothetical protein